MTALGMRTIGRSGRSITELGFGGAPLGSVGERLDADMADAVVDAAWNGGVRRFSIHSAIRPSHRSSLASGALKRSRRMFR